MKRDNFIPAELARRTGALCDINSFRRHLETRRTSQTPAEYASPVVIHTRTRWRMPDWLVAVALVAVCAGIGVMLAWRG